MLVEKRIKRECIVIIKYEQEIAAVNDEELLASRVLVVLNLLHSNLIVSSIGNNHNYLLWKRCTVQSTILAPRGNHRHWSRCNSRYSQTIDALWTSFGIKRLPFAIAIRLIVVIIFIAFFSHFDRRGEGKPTNFWWFHNASCPSNNTIIMNNSAKVKKSIGVFKKKTIILQSTSACWKRGPVRRMNDC